MEFKVGDRVSYNGKEGVVYRIVPTTVFAEFEDSKLGDVPDKFTLLPKEPVKKENPWKIGALVDTPDGEGVIKAIYTSMCGVVLNNVDRSNKVYHHYELSIKEKSIESDDFMVGEEVQVLETDYLGTILNIYTRNGVRYYDIQGRNLAGQFWRDSFAKHQLRKKPMSEKPIEADDFVIGDQVQVIGTSGSGTIKDIFTTRGVRYYTVNVPTSSGGPWSNHYEKHQLRKKTMSQISLKQAYERIREELGKNPDYFKAWVDDLDNCVRDKSPGVLSITHLKEVVADLFRVTFPEPSTKSLEEYHS